MTGEIITLLYNVSVTEEDLRGEEVLHVPPCETESFAPLVGITSPGETVGRGSRNLLKAYA